ncbi:hypothetical protein EDC04DRAFT_2892228 [Pisolithus marmoratus]|nr:hypothetical protein EDC04DRAFT_2892228 [Pisolithus marmoratus]
MPPKCKPNKVTGSSQLITVDDGDEPSHTKRQRADQLFDSELAPSTDSQPNGSQPWHSSCPGKGNGGQLQQLLNLKHVQTVEYSQPSAQSLDIATQGQAVNPMAPSHCDDDEESQMLPWASQPTLDVHIWPSFTASQPGQPFGFRIPSWSYWWNAVHEITQLSSVFPQFISPMIFAEHDVIWKILGLLPRNGHHNPAYLQQIVLCMLLHIIPMSIHLLLSPLQVPSPKINS